MFRIRARCRALLVRFASRLALGDMGWFAAGSGWRRAAAL
jgi:hypothetical protein